MKRISSLSAILCILLLGSCVPVKKFTDLEKKSEEYRKSNEGLKDQNLDLTVEVNELDGKILAMQSKLFNLEKEYEKNLNEKKKLETEKEQASRYAKELQEQIDMLKQGSSSEIIGLLSELQKLQESLQERENNIKASEDLLKKREDELKSAQETALAQAAELQKLQDALNQQREALSSLKEKLNQALRGFYDQGLSVYEKNGKIFVSMEEQLLFQTGSYTLDPKGREALKNLAGVLANNTDINILVEGHTDNVPLNGAGQIKDNWDLSVMRATAVSKIILQNTSIHPSRITAAGRSEFVPLDESNTPEGRKKNRRTEIILTPNLSEVFKIIESN
ncbi:MAG TPA: OmpA family protein [Prolixibacteraceae bacterium]|nr:OmpA family protein [Prolixibacteraceae bacterium]